MGVDVKIPGNEIPLLSWSLHLLGEAEWAPPRRAASRRSGAGAGLILVLKRERSASRLAVAVRFSGRRLRPSFRVRVAFRVSTDGAYPVTRSGLKTVPDGEFDWGGTSVKR